MMQTLYYQGSKGIRQWPINCCTSPIMIHTITPSLDYNQWLKSLETQLKKSPQSCLANDDKTLGTSKINNPMSPPSLKVRTGQTKIPPKQILLLLLIVFIIFSITLHIIFNGHIVEFLLRLENKYSDAPYVYLVRKGTVYYTSPQGCIITFTYSTA